MTTAIRTKYLPVTATKGSRILAAPMMSARDKGTLPIRSVTAGFYSTDAVGTFEKHAEVAHALAERLNWAGNWFGGDDGAGGYVFVRVTGFASPLAAAFTVINKGE